MQMYIKKNNIKTMTDINKYKQIGLAVLIGVVIIAGLTYAVSKDSTTSKNATKSSKSLTISEKSFDFGDIPINGGLVSHEYTLTNNSNEPISIKGMKTSCTCTTAVLKYKDRTSPKFGMHNNPSFYSQTIQPGESATVVATFDPLFHGPDATGPITRIVDISSDAGNYQVRFSGTVTP